MVIFVQLCKFIENNWTEHLKWANFMICRLYFNITQKKKKVPTANWMKRLSMVKAKKWASVKMVTINNENTSNIFKSIN